MVFGGKLSRQNRWLILADNRLCRGLQSRPKTAHEQGGMGVPEFNLIQFLQQSCPFCSEYWLFENTQAGAHTRAGLYSLIETSKSNGHEPYKYVCYLFDLLPKAKTLEERISLLPYRIDPLSYQALVTTGRIVRLHLVQLKVVNIVKISCGLQIALCVLTIFEIRWLFNENRLYHSSSSVGARRELYFGRDA